MLTNEQKLDAVIEYLRMHDKNLDMYLTTLEQNAIDNSPKKLEVVIRDTIINIGIKPSRRGFKIISMALELIYNDRRYLDNITNNLYPKLGEIFGITAKAAETSIRNACSDFGASKAFLADTILEIEKTMTLGGVKDET